MANVLGPKIEAIEENIEQTKLNQKTTLSTMITMKKTKAAASPSASVRKMISNP